ncbi:hypothetical protein [Streptomyces cyaneofuscatus]|uniref:hypothetical protein n=1 Tax=Streptomyces cyaneofuscatus TaxID=66883 RepID=UPI0037999122
MLSVCLGEGGELRATEPWQAAEFAAYVDRARDHLAPWLPWVHPVTDTASARRFPQEMADSQARDGARRLVMSYEGTLRGYFPKESGGRQDLEVRSVLAQERASLRAD